MESERSVCEAKSCMEFQERDKEDEDQAIQNIGQISSHVWLLR